MSLSFYKFYAFIVFFVLIISFTVASETRLNFYYSIKIFFAFIILLILYRKYRNVFDIILAFSTLLFLYVMCIVCFRIDRESNIFSSFSLVIISIMNLSFYNFVKIFFAFIMSLILCRKYRNVFNIILAFSTLILLCFMCSLDNKYEVFSILNLNLITNINLELKLIGISFLFITSVANLYGASQNKKLEIIIGSFYCLASLICLFAGDFISLFVGLEFMMIASSMMIFIGDHKESIKASKQYFITHLASSSLILIGISYIIAKTGSTEIISLTELMKLSNEGFFFYILIFIGCLINIASIPISNWVINCYPSASSTGFIYLIILTTKIAVVILIKLFTGFEILKFFGIIMMLYGGIYACIEENLKRILCYLTLSHIGLMLVLIGIGTSSSISSVHSYINIHILYTTLFAILLAILQDTNNIETSFQIKRIKNFTIRIVLLLGMLTTINFPFTIGFLYKFQLYNIIKDDILVYYLVLLLNSMIFLAIPFREYFNVKEVVQIKITKCNLFAITLILSVSHIPTIISLYLITQHNYEIKESLIKQLIVISIGIILAFIIKIRRKSTIYMNFDLLSIVGKSFNYLVRQKEVEVEEGSRLIYQKIIHSTLDKIRILHNQQTAIFIVFSLLIILLIFSFN